MNEVPNFDHGAIARLQRLGGDAFTLKMIQLFLDYTRTKIEEARQAQADGNLLAVEHAVHPIKSSAGNVGASRLRDLATEIEALAQAKNNDRLPDLIQDLAKSFAAVSAELEKVRGSLSSVAMPPDSK